MSSELNLFSVLDQLMRDQIKSYDIKNRDTQFQSKNLDPNVKIELNSLVEMLNISSLLLERYIDEYSKINEMDTQPPKPLKHNIQNQINFIVELIILIEAYTKILENVQSSMVELRKLAKNKVELILNQLTRFLLTNTELTQLTKETLPSILELKEHQIHQRLIDENQIKENNNHYNYFILESGFWLNLINSSLHRIIDDWWYEDHVLFKLLGSRLLKDFEKTITKFNNVQNTSHSLEFGKFKTVDYQVVQCIKLWYDNKILYQDLQHNLWEENFSTSIELLKSIIKNQEKIFLIIGAQPNYPQFSKIITSNQTFYDRSKLMKPVLEQSYNFYLLKQAIQKGNEEEIRFSLNQLLDKLEETSPEVEIPYLSSIPSLFDFLATSTNFMIELQKNTEEILDHNNQLFENFITRLQNALNQIIREITSLSNDSSNKIEEKLADIYNEIKQLRLAIIVLPPLTDSKESLKDLIRTVDLLVKSLIFETKSSGTTSSGIIKKIIYKLKAYYFAKVSSDSESLESSHKNLNERIFAQKTGSYITANILQIDIYRPLLQFICINNILPDLLILYTQDVPIIQDRFATLESWKKKFENSNRFDLILQNIPELTSEIKNYQSEISYQLKGVNFDQLIRIELTSKSALLFYQAVKKLGLGFLALKMGILEDAVINFEEAKTNAFESSEILKTTQNSEINQFSNQIFSFAQFCQNVERHPSLKTFEDFSSAIMLKLFREIVFWI